MMTKLATCPGGSPSSCCLALGALIGAWQGFWVAYVGIPAFIVTLAGMLLFRGLTLVVLKGATVGGLPDGVQGDRQRLPARDRPGHRPVTT